MSLERLSAITKYIMKGDEDTKYMVSSTHKYSDGTETVVNYTANPNQEEIETTVAEAVESDHRNPEVLDTETFDEVEEEVTEEVEEVLDAE